MTNPIDLDLTDDSRFEITPEEIKRIETRWKSDVDKKLDMLVKFASDYEDFMKMLIEREKQRERLRQAVIEKTLSALILAAVVGLFSLAWSGLQMDLKAAFQAVRGSTK